MNLAYKLNTSISFNGKTYRLDLTFDNVLRVFDAQREDIFTPAQKAVLAVELLAGRKAARLPFQQIAELLGKITDEYINQGAKAKKNGPRVLDYTQDAPLIYAAFRQAYGIDLDRERGRMDWRTFTALFQGLPENTRICEVMDIRRRPVPPPDKHNAEQRKALIEAKAFYALKTTPEEEKQAFQAGVDRLAASLMSRAKAGERSAGRR